MLSWAVGGRFGGLKEKRHCVDGDALARARAGAVRCGRAARLCRKGKAGRPCLLSKGSFGSRRRQAGEDDGGGGDEVTEKRRRPGGDEEKKLRQKRKRLLGGGKKD